MFEIWTLHCNRWSWYCIGIEHWSDVLLALRDMDQPFDQVLIVTDEDQRPGKLR